MKVLLTLFTIASLFSCGKIEDSYKYPEKRVTDSTFHAYIDELGLPSRTPIVFGTPSNSKVGECRGRGDGYKEIIIKKEYWDSMPDSYRLVLIAHEIGHCDYDLEHREGTQGLLVEYSVGVFPKICPLSIMQESNWGGSCWTQHKLDYLVELTK